MIARFSPLLAAASLLLGGLAAGNTPIALAEPVTLTLVTTNDLDRMAEKDGRGGLARLATVLAEERAESEHLLFLHAGDALSPSLLSAFDKGAHMIELLNLLEPDAFVPGNHEFDFGPGAFAERIAEAEFPVLAANLRAPAGGLPEGIAESRVVMVGEIPVGIVGVLLDDISSRSTPGDYSVLPPLQVAERIAGELRATGAKLIIAVAHVALPEDLAFVRSGAFDVVVSGDDHLLTTFYDGRTVLTESGEQADWVNILTLTMEQSDGVLQWRPAFRIVDTADVPADPAVAEKIAAFEAELSSTLDRPIGTTTTVLDSRRAAVRGGEAAIGNLVADAMREATGADAAVVNGGGIRGNKTYPAGTELTARDVLTELPFGNRTILLEVTGSQLRAVLENGFSEVAERAGRFPQLSGMTVEVELARPVGSRVAAVTLDDAPLDPSERYLLAANDFMARGGDGYDMLADASVVVGPGEADLLANQVIAYIRSLGEISPQVEGRIRFE